MSDTEYAFPLLMKSTHSGIIVRMERVNEHGDGIGTVIGSGNSRGLTLHRVGDWAGTWCMDIFKPFKG